MKIKIILFTINIFFFSFISSAQSYKFDKFIIYQNLTDSIESNVYCNSNNSNYFLRVLNSYHGQEALIYDLINKKVHYFDVIKKSIGDDSNEISFKYKNSKAVIEKYNTNYFFEYNKIDDDSLYNYSKLVVYKNKSKNKKINEIELKIKKDKSNYFPLYRFCTMHKSAAYKIAELIFPFLSEGEHNTISWQPANFAGTANIKTVENKGAVPPGMYNPTFWIGLFSCQHVTPMLVSTTILSVFWAEWNCSIFDLANWIASFNSAETSFLAISISENSIT